MTESKTKAILFGTGVGGKHGYQHLKGKYHIIGFADNDQRKQGSTFCGLPVHAPDEIPSLEFDRIVICSMYGDEILDQLTFQLSLPFEKIEILDSDVREFGPDNLLPVIIAAALFLTLMGWFVYRILFGSSRSGASKNQIS